MDAHRLAVPFLLCTTAAAGIRKEVFEERRDRTQLRAAYWQVRDMAAV